MDFLLQPAIWIIALLVWFAILYKDRQTPPVAAKFNKKTARPGDLFADGSSATSKTEKRVRAAIESAGYRLYPASTRVFTPNDADGKAHKYTPDIMLKKPKMIVEVDPHFWHGDPDKIAHDIDRNKMYAKLGYTIVRVRIGGTKALSPNDVVFPQGDFYPVRDSDALLKAIRKAKYMPPQSWNDPKKYIEEGTQGNLPMTAAQQREAQRRGMNFPPNPGFGGGMGTSWR